MARRRLGEPCQIVLAAERREAVALRLVADLAHEVGEPRRRAGGDEWLRDVERELD